MSDATEHPVPLRNNDLLDGRYRLIEQLGRGGMATVWRARDERLSRTVAVKILNGRLPNSPAAQTSVRTEARVLARLSHPHIANVYDCGITDDAAPYLVMELVEGRSLAAVLAGRAALPWHTAVSACAQVADALTAAHARGVVHRDVTAANVMLTPTGVKVIDFGICAVEGDQQTDTDGRLLGTPAYTAPERLDGQPVAPAADVYSVGSLLYQALSGRLPSQAATPEQLLLGGGWTEPDPLPPVDGLPAGIAEVCLRSLARDPDRRPTAAELADRLNAGLGTALPNDLSGSAVGDRWDAMTQVLPWTATAGGARARRRSRRSGSGTIISVVAGILAAGALAWLATDWGPAGDPVASQALGAPPPSREPQCAITYLLTGNTSGRFTATIIVTNTGSRQPSGWRLALDLPSVQRVDPVRALAWSQDGSTVTSEPQSAALAPGDAAQLTLSGDYSGANPLPTVFRLGGQACAATILGLSGTAPPADNPDRDAAAPGRNKDKSSAKGKHHGSESH